MHETSASNSVARACVASVAGERRLIVDGSVQSVAVESGQLPRGYWPAMLPEQRPSRALILGLGGGTLVHLLRDRFGEIPITGVDDDPEVLRLAREHFDVEPYVLEIVNADALTYLRQCRARFDYICIDLYRGETLAPVASTRTFQRCLLSALEPGGVAVWNLHRDRRGARLRRRAARSLLLERRVIAGLNLVLHLRRRGPRLRRPGSTL